jgi:hypothetical protein
MAQAINYAGLLGVPFSFSSNGDGFVFRDATLATGTGKTIGGPCTRCPRPAALPALAVDSTPVPRSTAVPLTLGPPCIWHPITPRPTGKNSRSRRARQSMDSARRNWRVLPIQFGLPSPSQILAELIRAADFEAVAYQSSKSGKKCLAVFVDRLAPGSCVALSGDPPAGVISRLDETTAEALAGWTELGIRPPQTPPPPPPSP